MLRDFSSRIPYILPSFALGFLFVISLILFSTTTEQESFASVVDRAPDSSEPIVTASLQIEDPFTIPREVESTLIPLPYDITFEAPDISTLKELFSANYQSGISRGTSESGELAITFDGGWSDHAREILDILSEKGIETTFFLTGRFIRANPELVQDIIANGHEVGNHTFSHPHLTDFNNSRKHRTLPKVSKEYFQGQLIRTAKLFKDITGEEMAPYWRAPFGELNDQIAVWALEAGFLHVGWTRDSEHRRTLDTLDWVSDTESSIYYTAVEIKERILEFDDFEQGLNGAIILMHLGTKRKRDRAVSVLPDIIDEVRMKGYDFVKISRIASEMLNESARIAAQRRLALNMSGN